MAITRCNEIGDGRSAGLEVRNGKYVRTATRIFRAETDQVHDEWYIIANATSASPDPVPSVFSPHPTNTSVKSRGILPRQEGIDSSSWLITVPYDDERSESDDEPDPIQRRIKYRLDWTSVTKDFILDAEGNIVQNTAGDFFQGLATEEKRPVLIATKNELAEDLDAIIDLAIDYSNAVNTDTFHGASPGHALCRDIVSGELQIENDIEYYAVQYAFEFKRLDELLAITDPDQIETTPDPWDRLVLNEGYYHLKTADDLTTRVENAGKHLKKLKRDGTLWSGDDADKFFYRVFKEFKRRPFSVLGV